MSTELVLRRDISSCVPARNNNRIKVGALQIILKFYSRRLGVLAAGDTLFGNMYAAYDALSSQMKAFLEPLTAEHDGALGFDKTSTGHPVSIQPVITSHPDTGKKLLSVNPTFTSRIMELPKNDSDALLAFLFKHLDNPHWQLRFKWTNHSIAFWTTAARSIARSEITGRNVRSGYSVIIKGNPKPLPVV